MLQKMLDQRNKPAIIADSSNSLFQTECEVCNQPYSFPNHRPMVLCLDQHIICLGCAKKISLIKSICPYCRIPFQIKKIRPFRGISFEQKETPYLLQPDYQEQQKYFINSQRQIIRMQVDIQIFQQNNRGFLDYSYEQWIKWIFGDKLMAKLIACFVLWGLALILIGVLPLTDNNSYLNQFQMICLLMGPMLLFMCIVILSIQWCMRWIDD